MVFSETLLVAPDEKRIMASVEKTRAMQIRRNSAAKIIQAAWRLYHFKCKILTIKVGMNLHSRFGRCVER